MPDGSSAEARIALWRRLAVLWRLKLAITLAMSLVFWSGYLFLSWHALAPVRELPMTWLDNWAGYRPHPWAWVYESIFLLTGFIPWLITTREDARRYVSGFALLAGASFATFAIFPVASPRPAGMNPTPFLIFITRVDGPLNAFPSLHAGCLVYTLALVWRLFGRRLSVAVAAALLIWAALILFATLATKQHYAVDLLAGGVLGWLADWVAWRKSGRGDIARDNTRRNTAATSQAG